MVHLPETRNSLLLKVRDPADAVAWEEFVAIYRPLIYRLARRRGLQDADAEDLAQRVLVSVSEAIRTWEKDERRGTFRAWLLRVARNAIINALTRTRPDAAVGGTSVMEQLEAQGTPNRDRFARSTLKSPSGWKRSSRSCTPSPLKIALRPRKKSLSC